MNEEEKLLVKIVLVIVLIFVVALYHKEVIYDYEYSLMTKQQRIHELHKLGIPTEEESRKEMGK